MSWRRDEVRDRERWHDESRYERNRSPVRRSESPRDRYRERDRRDGRDRYERDHDRYSRNRTDRERYERPRERRRSPRRQEQDSPPPPSPPRISEHRERSRSHSDSQDDTEMLDVREQQDIIESTNQTATNSAPGDWYCSRCNSCNFKWRVFCYRRNCAGKRSDSGVIQSSESTGSTDIISGITKRLLFRRLDALTTEEKILEALKERCSKGVIDSIAGITIGRETLTGASKCLAYINFNSIADSTAAHTELMGLKEPLVIDNREVLISYYNEPSKQHKSMHSNIDYSSYYNQAYSNQSLSEADRVNAAAAVAQSAISAAHARQMSWTPVSAQPFVTSASQMPSAIKLPTGDGKTVYTAPDTRSFLYDETSGYYYDPTSGLYYDGNTQYFFNNQTNQYMYWDASNNTYIAATAAQQNTDQPKLPNPPQATTENTITKEPEEKKKKDKDEKVKVAKKIAKDMERWARTLNQKKEIAKSNIVMEQPLDYGASTGSADIGFSVLGSGPSSTLSHQIKEKELSPPPTTDDFLVKKPTETFDSDEGIIEWSKLTCLLCKRKFPSAEVLTKHKTMSDLHKQNLAEFRKKNDLLPQLNGYRDRAAERRLKFGEDDIPIRKTYERPEPVIPIQSHPPPSVVDTIGGKMLQKMGWSQGRGLGKTEQGRIAPIEAEQRPGLAGLGQKRGIYTPTPGETYRDTVKKLMIARYKEVVGQEDGNK